ncbi:MAG: hypothetical protein PUH69_07540 [Faecalibacterium prausnitzii]|nr:hypothetical protein [Faecalibacterium prausnitzii]
MDDVRLIDAAALRDKILHEAYEKSNKTGFDGGMIWAFYLAANMTDHAATIDPESLRPESEWELTPTNTCECEWFRCKKCHHTSCCTDAFCGGCGAKMKNRDVEIED